MSGSFKNSARSVARESKIAGRVGAGDMDGGANAQIVPRTVRVLCAEEVEAIGGPGDVDAGGSFFHIKKQGDTGRCGLQSGEEDVHAWAQHA